MPSLNVSMINGMKAKSSNKKNFVRQIPPSITNSLFDPDGKVKIEKTIRLDFLFVSQNRFGIDLLVFFESNMFVRLD